MQIFLNDIFLDYNYIFFVIKLVQYNVVFSLLSIKRAITF